MEANISTRNTFNGEQVNTVVIAGNVPEMTKTVEFKIFEEKRSVRKATLKQVVRKESELGLTH